jgi:hypothetical protein
MSEQPCISIGAAIDEIALSVAKPGKTDLSTEITDKAIDYKERVLRSAHLTDGEIDRVIEAVIRGVLKRLEQIAIGGGQIGTAC